MTDYSQNQEQEHILKAVGCQPGRFLDIGAYDGNHFSNTRALIERGWGGVMVEPGLESFLALLKNHGENPKITLVHALIGIERGLSRFWATPDCMSTIVESWFENWKNRTSFHPPFMVPSITIEEFLKWLPGPVSFLSIDAEGISASLVLRFPLSAYLPRAICVEHDGKLEQCQRYAETHGYRTVHSNAENLVMSL
jgi:FkbM family methyltransferase